MYVCVCVCVCVYIYIYIYVCIYIYISKKSQSNNDVNSTVNFSKMRIPFFVFSRNFLVSVTGIQDFRFYGILQKGILTFPKYSVSSNPNITGSQLSILYQGSI